MAKDNVTRALQHRGRSLLKQQLVQFKTQARRNDLNRIMQDISARMSPEDMDAVAHYMAGLH